MKYYSDLLKKGCFTFSEAKEIIGTEENTYSILKSYMEKKYINKIRRGLYVVMDQQYDVPSVNKYRIASKITDDAVISHHSAFEYYGYYNQLYYQVTITTSKRFSPFTFDDEYYSRKAPNISVGVNEENNIHVTDIERTILDGICDFENDFGFEELIQCISLVPAINESKMLDYLTLYHSHFMYQKTGFIMEHFQDDLHISNAFLETCKNNIGKSSRYLLKEYKGNNVEYSNDWHLTVPKSLWFNMTGGIFNAEI